MTALSALLRIPEAPVTKPQRIGKARKDAPDERTVQRQIVKALRKLGLRVTAVPNGAHLAGTELRRMRQMAALKLDGLETGAADLLLTLPRRMGGPDMAWCEVKREGGVLSVDQIEFRDRCAADGIRWGCVTSLDQALAMLRGWGWVL
jgi:hypothetical protein